MLFWSNVDSSEAAPDSSMAQILDAYSMAARGNTCPDLAAHDPVYSVCVYRISAVLAFLRRIHATHLSPFICLRTIKRALPPCVGYHHVQTLLRFSVAGLSHMSLLK